MEHTTSPNPEEHTEQTSGTSQSSESASTGAAQDEAVHSAGAAVSDGSETKVGYVPAPTRAPKRKGQSWRTSWAHALPWVERLGWFGALPLLCVVAGHLLYSILVSNGILPVPAYDPYLQGRHQIYSLNIPTDVSFAGEKVPLTDPDVYERFDRELTLNVYWQANTLLLIKRSARWFPMIEQTMRANGVPQDFKYVAAIESMFENRTSPAGAAGFWQLVESSARQYGLEINDEVDERFHPQKATVAACKYIRSAKKLLGTWTSALASYNAGMGSVQRSMANQGQRSYYNLLMNTETHRYVFRLLSFKQIMEHTEDYGFQVNKAHLYKPYRLRYVKVSKSILDLAAWALTQGINYKWLKLYNPWLRKNTLTITAGKSYTIALPKDKVELDEDLRILKSDSLMGDSVAGDQLRDDDPALIDATPQVRTGGYGIKPLEIRANAKVEKPTEGKDPRQARETPKSDAGLAIDELDATPTDLPSTLPSPVVRIHTVVKGDNLSRIAKKYKVKVADLISRNKIDKRKPLQLGRQIVVD